MKNIPYFDVGGKASIDSKSNLLSLNKKVLVGKLQSSQRNYLTIAKRINECRLENDFLKRRNAMLEERLFLVKDKPTFKNIEQIRKNRKKTE